MPGPGFYDVKVFNIPDEKRAVSHSMFKSDSVRDLIPIKRGPGPAFYKNPTLQDPKKTFNFNPAKSWL